MLTKEEVEHIAKLARIEFSDAELETMRKDLSSILDYFEKLKEVNVDKIEPTTHSVELRNVTRKDSPEELNDELAESLIRLSPEVEKRHIKTKPIF